MVIGNDNFCTVQMNTHAEMWNPYYENLTWNSYTQDGFATDIGSSVTGMEPWMRFSNSTYHPSNLPFDTYSNAYNEHETVIARPDLHVSNVQEPFREENYHPPMFPVQSELMPAPYMYQPNVFSRDEQMNQQRLHYTAPVPPNMSEYSSKSQLYQASTQQSPPQPNDHPPNFTVLEQQTHSNQSDCYPTTLSDVNQIQLLQTSSQGESSTNVNPSGHTQKSSFTMGEHQMLVSHRIDHYYPATSPVNQQLPQTSSRDESLANYSPSSHTHQQPCGEVTMGQYQMQVSHMSDNYPSNMQICQIPIPYPSTNHEYASVSASPSVCASAHNESDLSSLDEILRRCNNVSEYPVSLQTIQLLVYRDTLLVPQRIEQGSPAHNESDPSSLDETLRLCNNVSEYPASFKTNQVRVDRDTLLVRQQVEQGNLSHYGRIQLQCDAHEVEFPQHERVNLEAREQLTDVEEKPFVRAVHDEKVARAGADDLAIHGSIHFKGKVFQCDVCKKSFSFKSLLRNRDQIYTRAEPKPLMCKWCKKSFIFKESLLEHVRFSHVKQMMSFHHDKCPVKNEIEQSFNTMYKSITSNKTIA